MGGAPQPTINPDQLRLQEQARTDRIDAIQDRVGAETRDLLIRFGRRQAFAGSSGSSDIAVLPGSIGLFDSPKLRAFGRGL